MWYQHHSGLHWWYPSAGREMVGDAVIELGSNSNVDDRMLKHYRPSNTTLPTEAKWMQ